MPGSTNDLIPTDISYQIRAVVGEDLTALDTVAINESGIFKKYTLAPITTSLGSEEVNTAVAYGNGTLLAAHRTASSIILRTYTVSASGVLDPVDSTTIGATTGARLNLYYISGDDFAIVYEDTGATTQIRVVRCEDPIVLGTNIAAGTSECSLDQYSDGSLIGTTASGTASRFTFSGTTVSKIALTPSSALPSANMHCAIANDYIMFFHDNSTNTAVYTHTLSGTTLTRTSIGTITDRLTNSTVFTIKGESTEFLVLGVEAVSSDLVAVGCTSGSTISAGSSATVASSGGYTGNIYHGVYDSVTNSYCIATRESNDTILREITQGGTTVGVVASPKTILETATDNKTNSAIAYNRSGMAKDTDNDLIFVAIANDTDSQAQLIKVKDVKPVYDIGVCKDTVTSGQEAQIVLRNAITGIQSRDHAGLTPSKNYYVGPTTLSFDSAVGPFFGWAIDANKIIVSESALS